MTEFEEFEAAEKAAIKRAERLYKLTLHSVGIVVGAAILFMLLYLVAKHSQGAAQDPFSLICQKAIIDSKRRGGK